MAEPGRRVPTTVVVGRVLLLLLAAAGVVSAFALVGRSPIANDVARYACPMHPQATSPAPGNCPICGMALEPLAARSGDATASAERTVPLPYPTSTVQPRVFSLEVRAPAVVDEDGAITALLYDDELGALEAGEPGKFAPTAAPNASVAVARAPDPSVAWDTSTSRVRFRTRSDAAGLHAGDAGWLILPARPRRILVVPAQAVQASAAGPYVLIASADGRSVSKRAIRIGKEFFGLDAVVSGLAAGERIAVDNAFFLDADRRLGAGGGRTVEGGP